MSDLPSPTGKILERAELIARYGQPRATKVVFTNGCFDLLHAGHVHYLDEARRMGEALVVGLNSDTSVRRLKGPPRPLTREADRALVLAGLASVDAVCVFEEDTPADLIEALLPDVLVKGGDYEAEDVVGGEAVRAAGGEVRIVPFVAGQSTTELLERVRQSRAGVAGIAVEARGAAAPEQAHGKVSDGAREEAGAEQDTDEDER